MARSIPLVVTIVATLAVVPAGCSFTIMGPPAKLDLDRPPVCEDSAPIRKTIDASAVFTWGVALLIYGGLGTSLRAWEWAPEAYVTGTIASSLLVVTHTWALVHGSRKTSACATAHDEWQDLQEGLARCERLLTALRDEQDAAQQAAMRTRLPDSCATLAASPERLARLERARLRKQERRRQAHERQERARARAREQEIRDRELRPRCEPELRAWRQERDSWRKLLLYDQMSAPCRGLADRSQGSF